MTDIELNAQALVSGGKEMFDRGQGRRFDKVDHDRRRQHCDPARADKGRGMLQPDDDFGGAGEAGNDAVKEGAAALGRGHAAL